MKTKYLKTNFEEEELKSMNLANIKAKELYEILNILLKSNSMKPSNKQGLKTLCGKVKTKSKQKEKKIRKMEKTRNIVGVFTWILSEVEEDTEGKEIKVFFDGVKE